MPHMSNNTETQQSTENVVDLPPLGVTETKSEEKKAAPAKKAASSKPKAKTPVKAKSTAKPKAKVQVKSKKPAKVKAKAKTPKVKRVAGTKAQTQLSKEKFAFLKKFAKENSTKEEKLRTADAVRQAIDYGLSRMGFKEASKS